MTGASSEDRSRIPWRTCGGWTAACAVVAWALVAHFASPGPARPVDSGPKQVRAAYLAYWDAWLRAGAGEPAGNAALPRFTASRQLAQLHAALQKASSARHVTRGGVGHAVTLTQIGRQTAVLTDCVDLHDWLIVDVATGRPIEQLRDRPRQFAAYTLAATPAGWKVTDSTLGGTC